METELTPRSSQGHPGKVAYKSNWRVFLLPGLAIVAFLCLAASNLFPPPGGGGGGGAGGSLIWTNNLTYVLRVSPNTSVPLDLVDGLAIVDTAGNVDAVGAYITNNLQVVGTAALNAAYVTNTANFVGTANIKNLITSNETVLTLTAWANSPSGAYDMSITGQKYSISAASAISSFINTRLGGLANFSTLTVTNPGGADLILYITASGYTENDGLRAYTITNKSMREIRFSASEFGIHGISQSWY